MARERVAKRKSAPASPADEPASTKQRSPTEPARMVTCVGDWTTSMRRLRDENKLLDVTLVVGSARIRAHKSVLSAHSPYLEGLFVSGLSESASALGEVTLHDVDGDAVSAIIDTFYTGELALSPGTVYPVLRAANMLVVEACEKAACDYFVEKLEPGSALEALGITLPGAAGEELRKRCLHFVVRYM